MSLPIEKVVRKTIRTTLPGLLNPETLRGLSRSIVADLVEATGGSLHTLLIRKDESYVLAHPITERFDGSLFECNVQHRIVDVHPTEPGEYRVLVVGNEVSWELID